MLPASSHIKTHLRRVPGIVLVAIFLLTALPVFGEDLSQMAARLVALRAEVETLSTRLEDRKAQTREQLRSLARQKADLASQIQRENLRIQRLHQSLAARQERVSATAQLDASLIPLVHQGIGILKEVIENGLPFKQHERLAELEDLRSQLASGSLPASRALARLWTFVEDELRLTRESGLYRQAIPLGESEVLADVARVGMVMMFFRTGDQTGLVRRDGQRWIYETLTEPGARDGIIALFDGLKKQIRQGYYSLPNTLPPVQEVGQ